MGCAASVPKTADPAKPDPATPAAASAPAAAVAPVPAAALTDDSRAAAPANDAPAPTEATAAKATETALTDAPLHGKRRGGVASEELARLYFRRAQHPSLRGADDDPTTLNLAEVCVRAVGSPR